jgi:recombination protein RecA
VDKSGAWFSFKGERIGQGRENAKEYLKEHPEVLQEIEQKVLEKYGVLKPPAAAAPPPAGGDEPEEKRARMKAVK